MDRRSFLRGALFTAAAAAFTSPLALLAPPPLPPPAMAAFVGTFESELAAMTRRAFVPKMVLPLYHPSPLLEALRSDRSVTG